MGLKNQQTWLGGYHLKLLFFVPWPTTHHNPHNPPLLWVTLTLGGSQSKQCKIDGLIVPDIYEQQQQHFKPSLWLRKPHWKTCQRGSSSQNLFENRQMFKTTNQPESVISKQIFILHFLTICCLFGENAEHDSPLSPTKTMGYSKHRLPQHSCYQGSLPWELTTPPTYTWWFRWMWISSKICSRLLPIAAFCFETH